MHISCSICKELFLPQSEVSTTRCGHVYHESCINRWLQHKRSCPQCRAKMTETTFRLFFDFENNLPVDPNTLQCKIDNLALKLSKKDKEINDINKQLCDMKKKNISLEKELGKSKEITSTYANTIEVLKRQNSILKVENGKMETLEQKNALLVDKINTLTSVEAVLDGTKQQVHDMLSKTPVNSAAVHQLCIYVEALKSQLTKSEEKYKTETLELINKYNRVCYRLKILSRRELSRSLKMNSGNYDKMPLHEKPLNYNTPEECEILSGPATNTDSVSHTDPVKESPKKQKIPRLNFAVKIINNLEKQAPSDSVNSDAEEEILPINWTAKRMKHPQPSHSKYIHTKLRKRE